MLRNSSRALLAVLVLVCASMSAGCNEDDTYFEIGVSFGGSGDPPDVFQLMVELKTQGGRTATLLFPEDPAPAPLKFNASAVVIVPPDPESYNITVTALDQDGQPVPDVQPGPGVGTVTPTNKGGKIVVGVVLDVRVAQVGLYQLCTETSQCPSNGGLQQTCTGAGVDPAVAPNEVCTLIGCDDSGDAMDTNCDSAEGFPGLCVRFTASNKFCLPLCESNDDCPTGMACRTDLSPGVCFSACTTDADCGADATCDTAEPDMNRRLCIPN
jgi:hypothetical protein